jgi:RNA polymerase sigma-70 factor (ECF subfamily)
MEPLAALEDHVRRDFARLVGVVAAVCGSRQDAEEAVAEAFARAWERAARGERIDNVAGWVVTVALRSAHSRWRRLRTEQRARPRVVAALAATASTDVDGVLDLRRAVGRLPRRQQQAVVLHYLLGFDVASVAGVLGVSDGTVKTALARARAKLAAALDAGGDG